MGRTLVNNMISIIFSLLKFKSNGYKCCKDDLDVNSRSIYYLFLAFVISLDDISTCVRKIVKRTNVSHIHVIPLHEACAKVYIHD